jgi:hypothetical protein
VWRGRTASAISVSRRRIVTLSPLRNRPILCNDQTRLRLWKVDHIADTTICQIDAVNAVSKFASQPHAHRTDAVSNARAYALALAGGFLSLAVPMAEFAEYLILVSSRPCVSGFSNRCPVCSIESVSVTSRRVSSTR